MIASWRGLVVAGAIAAVLAIAVAIDVARAPQAADRALVPGLDPDRVTELIWERTGQPAIRVVRVSDGWETRTAVSPEPDPAPGVAAESSAVGDVLAALRGARWHRLGAPPPVHVRLTVIAGAERRVLGIGEPIAGTEQTWLVVDGRGVVVDSWVARALDRDVLGLRIKAPLAGIRGARTVVIDGDAGEHLALQIDGNLLRLAGPEPLLIAADIAGDLERALGDITIVRIPDGPSTGHGVTITASGIASGIPSRIPSGTTAGEASSTALRVVLGGSCPGAPGLVAVSGTAGDGCVEAAVAAAVARAIDRLQQPQEAVVERRPIPFEPRRIVLPDTVALEPGTLRVGDAPADQARVAELLAALAVPADVVKTPATPPGHHLVITGPGSAEITLDLFAEHVLARHREPIALRPAPGAWNLLVRPSRELRDTMLWIEEPTAITAVQIDDVGYQRGATIGDWSRRPTGAADARALEALVAQLAAPRALGFLDDQVVTVHRVTVTMTPPTGAPVEHVVALGAPRATGCPARVERDVVVLPTSICAQVAALAR